MSEKKSGSPLGDHGAKVERDGWTGKRFAAIVFSGFVLVSVLNRERETVLAQARLKTKAARKLTNWIKTQPEDKRLYDGYYNHQHNILPK